MRHWKNDILLAVVISILLSLFVNFSLFTATYEKNRHEKELTVHSTTSTQENTNRKTDAPSVRQEKILFREMDQIILYKQLFWIFLFAFILFLINLEGYRIGERLFHHTEYKAILLVIGCSTIGAYLLFQSYPILNDLFYQLIGKENYESNITFMFFEERGNKNIPPHTYEVLPPPFHHPFMTMHLFVLLVVILSTLLMRLLNSKQQMRLEYEQLKSEKLQTSYNALMGQINPHFFFNSLNGLSSLIQNGNQEQTLTYLNELSAVFRYILQSNKKELVTLAEELQFVKAYTYLLSVRYEGKLFFSIQVEKAHLLWYLPILSILPLIENAVKHNIISKQYPLQIDIYSNRDNYLVVSNPVQPKIEESAGSGIGLKNLWGRYHMLTGKDIHISNRKSYFKVSLPLLNTPVRL